MVVDFYSAAAPVISVSIALPWRARRTVFADLHRDAARSKVAQTPSTRQTLEAILLKVELRCEPSRLQAAMQTTATRAAIRPYSIAVTPDSSLIRFEKMARIAIFLGGLDAITIPRQILKEC
jgi:hypothetical protein